MVLLKLRLGALNRIDPMSEVVEVVEGDEQEDVGNVSEQGE